MTSTARRPSPSLRLLVHYLGLGLTRKAELAESILHKTGPMPAGAPAPAHELIAALRACIVAWREGADTIETWRTGAPPIDPRQAGAVRDAFTRIARLEAQASAAAAALARELLHHRRVA